MTVYINFGADCSASKESQLEKADSSFSCRLWISTSCMSIQYNIDFSNLQGRGKIGSEKSGLQKIVGKITVFE